MPLFKVDTHRINDVDYKFRVNVDGNGQFWCDPPQTACDLLDLEKRITGSTYDQVRSFIVEKVRGYHKSITTVTYVIRYRFHLSNFLKAAINPVLMTSDLQKRTQGIGNWSLPSDDLALIINWFPLVITQTGKYTRQGKIRIATEEDILNVKSYGTLFEDKLHLAIDRQIFYEYVTFHNFDNKDKYFDIPLTEETFLFFQNLENNFVRMVEKMLSFLTKDSESIVAHILQFNQQNMLSTVLNENLE